MRNARWVSLGFALGALLAVTPSCGPAYVCGPGSCFGCCDATGACVGGQAVTACGRDGAQCGACTSTETCEVGVCKATGGGGGGGAAGGGTGGGAAGGGTGGAGGGQSNTQPTGPLELTVQTFPSPVQLGTNTLQVTIKGANGVPVANANLTAKTWMPQMGHGSATPTVTNAQDGEYVVQGVSFTMYGTWTVTLTATAAGGTLNGQRVVSYTVQ